MIWVQGIAGVCIPVEESGYNVVLGKTALYCPRHLKK